MLPFLSFVVRNGELWVLYLVLGDVVVSPSVRDDVVDSLSTSVTYGSVTGNVLPPSVTAGDDEVVMIRVDCGALSLAVSDSSDE